MTTQRIDLTDRDLADLARLLAKLTGVSDRPSVIDPMVAPATQPLVARAIQIMAARSRRLRTFPPSMFGEPAWDMLLYLYVAEARGLNLRISRVTEQAGAPSTTALRWLEHLDKQGLIRREAHPHDGRSSIVELSDKARQMMEVYLSETLSGVG